MKIWKVFWDECAYCTGSNDRYIRSHMLAVWSLGFWGKWIFDYMNPDVSMVLNLSTTKRGKANVTAVVCEYRTQSVLRIWRRKCERGKEKSSRSRKLINNSSNKKYNRAYIKSMPKKCRASNAHTQTNRHALVSVMGTACTLMSEITDLLV